jgi:C-mannosyltransferase DPY19L
MWVEFSSSYLGGLLSAAALVFNHGEATRVMWTPPLRESFSYPVLLLQMLTLSFALRQCFFVIQLRWSLKEEI